MKCLNCNKREGQFRPPFGWVYCKTCQDKHKAESVKETVEITTSGIKEERKFYSGDIVQPFREGVLSKEYLREHGTKGIKVTKEDIKNAKDVWNHSYYKPE